MSGVQYTGPWPVSQWIHNMQHYTSDLTKISVPDSPTQPFVEPWISQYTQSIEAAAAAMIFLLIIVFILQVFIGCCCRCDCCYGDPVSRYAPPVDNENDLALALRHKYPTDEVSFYHEHVDQYDSFPHDDPDDPLREALGINNTERLMRRRRRRLVIFSVILVLFMFTILVAILVAAMYYNGDVGKSMNATFTNFDSTIQTMKTASSQFSKLKATSSTTRDYIAQIKNEETWTTTNQARLTEIGGKLVETEEDLVSLIAKVDMSALETFRSKLNIFEIVRLYVSWFSILFLFLVCCMIVLAVIQCRNKCCIELEERTKYNFLCSLLSYLAFLVAAFILFWLVVIAFAGSAFLAISVAASDYCTDPAAWTQSLLSSGSNNFTNAGRTVKFYSDCSSNATNSVPILLNDTIIDIGYELYYILPQVSDSCGDSSSCDSLKPLKNNLTLIFNSMESIAKSVACAPVSAQLNAAYDNICHPFLRGFLVVVFAMLSVMILLLFTRPCLNVVRFYRGHELMASLHAQLKVNKPLMKGSQTFGIGRPHVS